MHVIQLKCQQAIRFSSHHHLLLCAGCHVDQDSVATAFAETAGEGAAQQRCTHHAALGPAGELLSLCTCLLPDKCTSYVESRTDSVDMPACCTTSTTLLAALPCTQLSTMCLTYQRACTPHHCSLHSCATILPSSCTESGSVHTTLTHLRLPGQGGLLLSLTVEGGCVWQRAVPIC